MRAFALALLFGPLATACQAGLGDARNSLKVPLRNPVSAGLDLVPHPFAAIRVGTESFADALRHRAQSQIADSQVEIRATDSTPQGASLAAGIHSYDLAYFVNGVRIDGLSVRGHQLASGGEMVLGHIPDLLPGAVANAPTAWPPLAEAQAAAATAAERLGLGGFASGSRAFGDAQKAYRVVDQALRPLWIITIFLDHRPYEARVDGAEVLEVVPTFFDLASTARGYEKTVNDGRLIDLPLPGLTDPNKLASAHLALREDRGDTDEIAATGESTAIGENGRFDFAADDFRFQGANMYAHAEDHMHWLEANGGEPSGERPLYLVLTAEPGEAHFLPKGVEGARRSQIRIGQGDGISVQNLATDRDVPAHEMGHVFVFKYLSTTAGEAGALHEGLADALVYLHYGAPKLYQSVCVDGYQGCMIPGGALRTVSSNAAIEDDEWLATRSPHKHGLPVSGLFYDMQATQGVSADKLMRLLMKAVSLLRPESGLRDLALALLTADRELFDCSLDGNIRAAFQSRRFDVLVSDVAPGCGALAAIGTKAPRELASLKDGAPAKKAPALAREEKKKKGTCGVAGNEGAGASLLLLSALVPLLVATRRR